VWGREPCSRPPLLFTGSVIDDQTFLRHDIHGSNVCYRKFLNALPIYGADVAVLNGDLLGSAHPHVEKAGGGWECHLMGMYTEMNTEQSSPTSRRSSRTRATTGPSDSRRVRATNADPKEIDRLFKHARLRAHPAVARTGDERSKARAARSYICPGNDDWWEVDDIDLLHEDRQAVRQPRRRHRRHEMVSCSRSNPTPWDTPARSQRKSWRAPR